MTKNNKAVISLNNSVDENTSKIEAIKNLIFGDHIEAYDAEFETIKRDILSKKKALDKLIDEVGDDLKLSIDNLSTDVNIRITELEEKFEEKITEHNENNLDKRVLGKMLIQLGEKIAKK